VSIPFFYRHVELAVMGADQSVLVDGGMLSNFPVDIFDRTDGKPPRWPTIGIKLSAKQKPEGVEHVVLHENGRAAATKFLQKAP